VIGFKDFYLSDQVEDRPRHCECGNFKPVVVVPGESPRCLQCGKPDWRTVVLDTLARGCDLAA
jgi:hypothetical protein